MEDKDETTTTEEEETTEDESKEETDESKEEADDSKDDSKEESEDTEVEVDDEVSDKIASSVATKLLAKMASEDTPKRKVAAPAVQFAEKHEKILKNEPNRYFAKQLVALVKGESGLLRDLNGLVIEKSNYQNETTDADGGVLVPPAEFDTQLYKLQTQFGAAAQAGISRRNISGDSIQWNKLLTDVSVSEAGEATAVNASKQTYENTSLALRKFIGKAIVTRELSEDEAIDIIPELQMAFAREFAQQEDKLVFTDATTGLLNNTGTYAYTVGSSWAALDLTKFDTAAELVVPDGQDGAKWFMNRKAWSVVKTSVVNSETNNLAANAANQSAALSITPPEIWGTPVVKTEVLSSSVGDNNTTFAVYGNLAKYGVLIQKRNLVIDLLKEATVTDAGGSDFNLADQDAQALRAVKRMNFAPRLADAFVLVGTGTVS